MECCCDMTAYWGSTDAKYLCGSHATLAEKVMKAERERCAKIALSFGGYCLSHDEAEEIAAKIREGR